MTEPPDFTPASWPDSTDVWPEQILQHFDWVRRLAARLVRDEHTAEDLAQRTFVTALQRPPGKDRGSIRGWLTRVLVNDVAHGAPREAPATGERRRCRA